MATKKPTNKATTKKSNAKSKPGFDAARAIATITGFHDSFTLDVDDDDGFEEDDD
jgi:hypothetical protein